MSSHYTAIIGGSPCGHRHRTASSAGAAHPGCPIEVRTGSAHGPLPSPKDNLRQRAVRWTDVEWRDIQAAAAAQGTTAALYVREAVREVVD